MARDLVKFQNYFAVADVEDEIRHVDTAGVFYGGNTLNGRKTGKNEQLTMNNEQVKEEILGVSSIIKAACEKTRRFCITVTKQ
jgi:hypothetical protein